MLAEESRRATRRSRLSDANPTMVEVGLASLRNVPAVKVTGFVIEPTDPDGNTIELRSYS
ncbi:MAG: hypothetical protein QOG50_3044 [Actinomycetota bacterium]|jgi:hypothetical protein|nr:hypothetical protein [Actinomycetota bacterium]